MTQQEVCAQYGVEPACPQPGEKVGVARVLLPGAYPLHGLRISPENGTCGWYLWTGDWSDAPDFFEPMHVTHVEQRCPEVIPYLTLPPGWRVLLAPEYADVWFDPELRKR